MQQIIFEKKARVYCQNSAVLTSEETTTITKTNTVPLSARAPRLDFHRNLLPPVSKAAFLTKGFLARPIPRDCEWWTLFG